MFMYLCVHRMLGQPRQWCGASLLALPLLVVLPPTTPMHVYRHVNTCMYMYIHICIYVYVYIHIHVYLYI